METMTFQTIEQSCKHLQDYAESFQNQDLQNNLKAKVRNRLNLDYKIAIVANMSAGKSTLINALFGEEVLPAFNHATTDCETRIFSTQEKGAVIHFSNEYKVKLAYDNHQNFIAELTQYAQKDEDCNDDKYKNVKRIDLSYPFKNIYTQNAGEMEIIFVDTPGPNATGSFAEKHKEQTRGVLHNVDLALFVFDYGQLDANLSSDEQGLWHTIKERVDKDKDFNVFLVLNKVDMAFSDNAKLNAAWYYHEQKAIDKLKNAAKKYGISEPKIYPISSYYALLRCKPNKNYDDEDKLELFEKKFKRQFQDEWEKEMLAYLGIEAFTEAINQHIDYKPKKRWEELAALMKQMIDEETIRLKGELELLEIPNKDEPLKRLDKASKFIKKEAPEIQQRIEQDLNRIAGFYSEKIQELIKARIQKDMLNPIDTIAKKTIAFAESFADGDNEKIAAKNADKRFDMVKIEHESRVELRGSRDFESVKAKMQDFIQEQLHNCKLNYTNIRSDIKNLYRAMEKEKYECETEAKNQLEQGLDKQLELQKIEFKAQSIDIDSLLSFESAIPPSILDYHYEEAEYEEEKVSNFKNLWGLIPWWGDTKTVQKKAEQKFITINGIELQENIEQQVRKNIDAFQTQEIRSYQSSIEKIHEGAKKLFADFITAKQQQIENLTAEIADIERQEEHKQHKEEQLQFLHSNPLCTQYTTQKEA